MSLSDEFGSKKPKPPSPLGSFQNLRIGIDRRNSTVGFHKPIPVRVVGNNRRTLGVPAVRSKTHSPSKLRPPNDDEPPSPISPRSPAVSPLPWMGRRNSEEEKNNPELKIESLDWVLGKVDMLFGLAENGPRGKPFRRIVRAWARSQCPDPGDARQLQVKLERNVLAHREAHPDPWMFHWLWREPAAESVSHDTVANFLAARRALLGSEYCSDDRAHFRVQSSEYVFIKDKNPSARVSRIMKALEEHDISSPNLSIRVTLAADAVQDHTRIVRVHRALQIAFEEVLVPDPQSHVE